MTLSLPDLSKRAAKLERDVAERARRKELVNCVCREVVSALHPEELEAELNLPCSVHGIRRFGFIVTTGVIKPDVSLTEESLKMKQVVDAYELRLRNFKSSQEAEDDSQES